jgi:hypothetical protein
MRSCITGMTNERWQQFIDLAKDQFEGVEISTEELSVQTMDGPEVRGSVDTLIFEKTGDRYKLERENRPRVLEKKEHFAKRATDTARTEYVFSTTEFTHKLRVYKETDAGDWDEISSDSLGL